MNKQRLNERFLQLKNEIADMNTRYNFSTINKL